jgi:cyclophilin family peptidyl-prolyl cis-trans isomerase
MFKKIYLFMMLMVLTSSLFAQSIKKINRNLKKEAPDSFHVVFYTSKGEFEIAVNKSWSPLGATRFYQLVKSKFYNNMYIFRSTTNYIQFGINDQPELNAYINKKMLVDEKLVQSNTAGRIAFATGGVNNRTSQIFIIRLIIEGWIHKAIIELIPLLVLLCVDLISLKIFMEIIRIPSPFITRILL